MAYIVTLEAITHTTVDLERGGVTKSLCLLRSRPPQAAFL